MAEKKTTEDLLLSRGASRARRFGSLAGEGTLLLITSLSVFAVLFIFYFIVKDALPFFQLQGFKEFFTSTRWYPSSDPASFGTAAIFVGTGLVTLGAVFVAVPLGITAAICMSDILKFEVRQMVKPVIEVLAAIPSVAYGFFALVIFAPLLQERGGSLLSTALWITGIPVAALGTWITGSLISIRVPERHRRWTKIGSWAVSGLVSLAILAMIGGWLSGLVIESGTNALNVSIILGITLLKVVMPAAASGIVAAVILGVMRAVGETMVVWMASGNAAQIPEPFFNFLEPVRTLTATIAGDMGEADHVTGSARYSVLFAMALSLLAISFVSNLVSERFSARIRRQRG